MGWVRKYNSHNDDRITYTQMGYRSTTYYIYIYSSTKDLCKVCQNGSNSGEDSASFGDSTLNWNSTNAKIVTSTSAPSGTTAITGADTTVYYANVTSSVGGCEGKYAWYKITGILNGQKTTFVHLDRWESSTTSYSLNIFPSLDGTSTSTTGGNVRLGSTYNTTGTYNGGASITLNASANTGYHFEGWYRNGSKISSSISYSLSMPYVDTYIYGKFALNTYTIYFSANSGSGAPSSQTATYNSSLTLSSTKPTRTNYTFLGWSTSSSATSATYTAGQMLTSAQINSLVSGLSNGGYKYLYAVWSYDPEYTLTIKFHLNGGRIEDKVHLYGSTYYTYKSDSLIYSCNSDGSSPTLYTKTYTCKASQSSSTTVDLVNVSSIGATRKKDSNTYYSVPSGTTAWRSNPSPTSGYTISQDSTTVYAVLNNQNLTSNRTLTVYINWSTNGNYALDVQYNLNGGILGTYSDKYLKGSDGLLYDYDTYTTKAIPHRTHLEYNEITDTINLLNVDSYDGTRNGYYVVTQSEYQTSSSGGTIINQDIESTNSPTVSRISGSSTLANRVVTLYIRWVEPVTYTITLNNQIPSGEVDTTAGTATIYEKYGIGYYSNSSGTTSISSITKPIRPGWTFAGYYTTSASSGGTQIINSSGTITSSNTYFGSNSTIYARWTEVTTVYDLYVQYNINGGRITKNEGLNGKYYKVTNNLVYQSSSASGTYTVNKTHGQCKPNDSENTVIDLLNVETYNGAKDDCTIKIGSEYITSNDTIINEDTFDYEHDANPATIFRLLGGHKLTSETTITLNINWTTNTNTIYIKTSNGWVSGTPYIKTSDGWVQGTVYIKTSSGWVQST